MCLGLSKFQGSNRFPDFFSKRLQILSGFLACKSITMTNRSSLSFIMLHWFLAKLRALDLVNFRDQTVFRIFFLNAYRYWADFWHVSQSPWLTDQIWVLLHSIDFLARLRVLNLVNFRDWTVFWTFFLNACRYWADFWHASQSPWLRGSVSPTYFGILPLLKHVSKVDSGIGKKVVLVLVWESQEAHVSPTAMIWP